METTVRLEIFHFDASDNFVFEIVQNNMLHSVNTRMKSSAFWVITSCSPLKVNRLVASIFRVEQ
jgi:hypothetical protein